MADASGSQLRAEGVNIQPANSHQLTADKGAQQFFTWRTEAVFPALPVLRQAAQHIEMLGEAFTAQSKKPESAQLFQDSIKQLQHGNHEFQDKNNNIHGTHTRLLWYRSTTGWRTFPPPVASQGIRRLPGHVTVTRRH